MPSAETPRGYLVVEVPELDCVVGWQQLDNFSRLVLALAVQKLRETELCAMYDVEFDVITVTYLGSYPAIGVHYKGTSRVNLTEPVIEFVQQLIRESTIADLVQFAAQEAEREYRQRQSDTGPA